MAFGRRKRGINGFDWLLLKATICEVDWGFGSGQGHEADHCVSMIAVYLQKAATICANLIYSKVESEYTAITYSMPSGQML